MNEDEIRAIAREVRDTARDVFAVHDGLPAPGVEDSIEYFYSLMCSRIDRWECEFGPTFLLSLKQRIEHVGGVLTPELTVQFGSPMAVNALLARYARDHARSNHVSEGGKPEWCSVKNALPLLETPVLLIRNGDAVIGERVWYEPTFEEPGPAFWYWACPHEYWIDDGCGYDVTHWMPLPSAPKPAGGPTA